MDSVFGDKLEKLLSNDAAMAKIREIADAMQDTGKPGLPDLSPAPPAANPSNVANLCAMIAAIKPFLDGDRLRRAEKLSGALKTAETAKKLLGL